MILLGVVTGINEGAVFLMPFILLIVAFSYWVVKRTIKNKKTRRERGIKFENYKKKRRKFVSKKEHEYIQKFVKRHGLFNSLSVDSILMPNDSEKTKLRKLLNQKGFEFDEEEIEELIIDEMRSQVYNDFRDKITHDNPSKLDDYARNLLEIYGENYEYFLTPEIGFFKKLLRENRIPSPQKRVRLLQKIEKIKEQLELENFEKRLSEGYPVLSINDLDSVTGHEFERFLKKLFANMGYQVTHTKLSGDQGADLVVSKHGEKTVVQAKRYTEKVNNKAVQEVVASIKHFEADRGMVVTNSYFTKSAIQLANSNQIELINRDELKNLISEYY